LDETGHGTHQFAGDRIGRKVGQSHCTSLLLQVLSVALSFRYIDRVKTNLLTIDLQPTVANCFRLFLQSELGRRCANNPQYSMRAFAKYLGVDHASLSQLLRGKRALTGRTILKLGTRLGLDRHAVDGYVAREAIWARNSEDEPSLIEVRQLADDTSAVISDWYHYAILELTRLHNFKPDSRWIARVLGITADDVNLALSRLLRLGLLEMVARDRWIDRSGNTTASLAEFNRAAVERLSEQVHRLMLKAIGTLPEGRYEHSSTTVALSTAQLPAVLERIARFRRELIALFDQGCVRDDVYQLEINLFPMTTLHRDKENNSGTTRNAVADPGERAR
jgi:uncharacterized protein (TIGR02147 family)